MTKTERQITDLEKITIGLTTRLDNLTGIGTIVSGLESRVAVLEERLNELKKSTELSSQRSWSLVPPIIGGVIGAVLTLLVQLVLRGLGTAP